MSLQYLWVNKGDVCIKQLFRWIWAWERDRTGDTDLGVIDVQIMAKQ